MHKAAVLLAFTLGIAGAQQAPNPLHSLPAPLVGALIDLYANYQQNRPHLPMTAEHAAAAAERARVRDVKVASGVAIGAAIGTLMVNNPRTQARAAAIGAVAGAVAGLVIDHYQAKVQAKASLAPPLDDNDAAAAVPPAR